AGRNRCTRSRSLDTANLRDLLPQYPGSSGTAEILPAMRPAHLRGAPAAGTPCEIPAAGERPSAARTSLARPPHREMAEPSLLLSRRFPLHHEIRAARRIR